MIGATKGGGSESRKAARTTGLTGLMRWSSHPGILVSGSVVSATRRARLPHTARIDCTAVSPRTELSKTRSRPGRWSRAAASSGTLMTSWPLSENMRSRRRATSVSSPTMRTCRSTKGRGNAVRSRTWVDSMNSLSCAGFTGVVTASSNPSASKEGREPSLALSMSAHKTVFKQPPRLSASKARNFLTRSSPRSDDPTLTKATSWTLSCSAARPASAS
mmetsp:Transcript_30210/g.69770  ORF Transcript_30210/g.69770 Transcript_30210/m.69770 type:complete len:218 (-) Transcript_30210:120-773(-)